MSGLVLCISASNIIHSNAHSVSKIFCDKIAEILRTKNIGCEMIDLRDYSLHPCIGCGKCFDHKRCCIDNDFNKIYDKIVKSDAVFFVSPHYAPIPAKLCMLLEKMEEITFLHWWKVVPYHAEWDTGISLPVQNVIEKDGIFPVQEYGWFAISQKIEEYVGHVIKAMV